MSASHTMHSDHTFTDAHGVVVHYYSWHAAAPRGIVQIAHGLGEYATRYERLAQELVAAGYSVYADDHRGHGATGMEQNDGDASKLGALGPGGLRAAIADIRQLSGIIRAENSGVPLALLGQSWGSLMVQDIVNGDDSYDAIVLAGTAYRTLRRMNGGDLNKRHKHLGTTGFEWLSRDPAVAQAFLDDPLTFYAAALKLFGVADGLRLLGKPRRGLRADLPVLIMIGSEDPLGGEKSVRMLAESYIRRGGLRDVRLAIYDGARHEVFNETNRDEVIGDLIAWLDSRL